MQREDQTDHGNGLGTKSSESAVNHLSKSVVRDTEGAAKQKPHATFCGNRGRATAPGDPVRRTILYEVVSLLPDGFWSLLRSWRIAAFRRRSCRSISASSSSFTMPADGERLCSAP